MFTRTLRCCNIPVCILLLSCLATGQANHQQSSEIRSAVTRLPIVFEPNVGQTAEAVRYSARGSGYGLFLTNKEMVVVARGTHGEQRALKMWLVGANVAPEMTGEETLPGRSSYIRGNDPSRWRQGIEQYGAVRIREVYDGIDVRYYGSGGRLEHDYIVAPGADATKVRMRFDENARLKVDSAGNLRLRIEDEEFVLERPIAYQQVEGRRTEIASRFEVARDNTVGFALGAYDDTRELVIDPVLQYGTYLGGSDHDFVTRVVNDAAGNVFVFGQSWSADFPLAGGIARPFTGKSDFVVAKFNPTLSVLLYSTYIGGSGQEYEQQLAVDSAGDATITGLTESKDYPVLNPIGVSRSWTSGIVTRLAADGTMVFSTYLGDSTAGLAYDGSGNTYVSGVGAGIATSSDAFQAVAKAGTPGFVALLSPTGQMLRATYLSGSLFERGGIEIKLRGDGTIAVAGLTDSVDFPVTPDAFSKTWSGGTTGFAVILNASLTELRAGTYLPEGIFAFDPSGNLFVASRLTAEPTPGALNISCYYLSCVYLSKISADLTTRNWVAKFGSMGSTNLDNLISDDRGDLWLSATADSKWPLVNPVMQGLKSGQQAIAAVSSLGTELLFSTHMPAGSGAIGKVKGLDEFYVGGNFENKLPPTTEGAFQRASAGKSDIYVAKIDLTKPYGTVCLDADWISFGEIRTGTSSLPIDRKITNCGTGPLHVSGVSSEDPVFTVTHNCGTLAPGGSCTISTVFSPTESVSSSKQIFIDSDSLMTRTVVTAGGGGVAPLIHVSVPSFEFGNVLVGISKSTTIWISNYGRAFMRVRGAKVTGPFTVTGDCLGGGIGAGFTCDLVVKASPTQAGQFVGSIILDTDSEGGDGSISLTVTGMAGYPVPVIDTTYPNTMQTGSGTQEIQVNGRGFDPTSTVRLDGSARVTKYVDDHTLTMQIPASDMLAIKEAQITVSNGTPGGGVSNPSPVLIYSSVSIPTSVISTYVPPLAYDPGSQRLYAATSTSLGEPLTKNDIQIVDPVGLKVTGSLPLGNSTPSKLTRTEDGKYLYFDERYEYYNNVAKIRRVDLAAQTLGPDFSTGSGSFALIPGTTDSVVMDAGGPENIVVSDNGVLRPKRATGLLGPYPVFSQLEFATSADAVFRTVVGGITKFAIDSQGVSEVSTMPGDFSVGQNDRLYSLKGDIYDAKLMTKVGTCTTKEFNSGQGYRSVVPNAAANRIYYFDSNYYNLVLSVCDASSMREANVFTFYGSGPGTIATWGTDNFAILSSGRVRIGRSTTLVSGAMHTPVKLTGVVPSTLPAGSPNSTVTLTGENFQPGAKLRWNDFERTTTYVSSTQVQAVITAADLTRGGIAYVTVANPAPAGGVSGVLKFTIEGTLDASSTGVDFGEMLLGGAAVTKQVTLSSSSGTELTNVAVSTTGTGFTQTNDCRPSMLPGETCTVAIQYTPGSLGTASGTMLFGHDGAASRSISLQGRVIDFALNTGTGTPTSTVTAGQTATYNLTTSGAVDGMSGTVALSCTGAPTNASCAVVPSSVTLSGRTEVPFTVNVTTQARSSASMKRGNGLALVFAVGVLAFVFTPKLGRNGVRFAAVLVIIGATLTGCGGGGGGGGGGGTPPPPPVVTGTPAGTYTLTLQATYGGQATKTTQIKLTVQ